MFVLSVEKRKLKISTYFDLYKKLLNEKIHPECATTILCMWKLRQLLFSRKLTKIQK